MKRLVCRLIGHDWKRIGGSTFMSCYRCGQDGYFIPTWDE